MKIDQVFLRSKVGRRIFILFIACALVPISALALISFLQVTKQLEEQSQSRLYQAAKDAGVIIYERLKLLESEMKIVASTLTHGSSPPSQATDKVSAMKLSPGFKALGLLSAEGIYTPLTGRAVEMPPLDPAEMAHLSSGKTLLTTSTNDPRILLSSALNPADPESALMVAEIETLYLMGAEEGTLPPRTEFFVLDHAKNTLYSSLSKPPAFPEAEVPYMFRSYSGQFEWKQEDVEYVARYISLFTKFDFFAPGWVLVIAEPKANVLAPMAQFKKIFSLIVLLSLWVVLLMSVNQIRRSLDPLEKLQAGTRRIAKRDFQTKMTVTSCDEFAELAASFNAMAEQLGKQFNAMTVMNEIDRSILSALDTKKIVYTVLARMSELFPCECVALALLKGENPNGGDMYIKDDNPRSEYRLEPITLRSLDLRRLHADREHLLIDMKKEDFAFLEPLTGLGISLYSVFPIFLGQSLSAILALGYRVPMTWHDEDRMHARQLADQVAVALSNARLLEDLEELNWGTLYALARTIDAKSPWTGGHSERVTKLALKIGRVMGLGEKELEDLHRAGLLHDIGKLGIPPDILDKPGRLTREELQLMRKHPYMGARILEPIGAYATVTPIVLQHHENYDGSGYPLGLAGEKIVLGARIFAVADQFDAITSDRPYRSGMDRDKVIEYIKKRAGRRFDPHVVRAFLQVMRQESKKGQRVLPRETRPGAA